MKISSKYAFGVAAALLIACVAMAAPQPSESSLSDAFRIATYNIRCPVDKTPNSWSERAGRMRALIQRHKFDLIGLQEATAGQIDDLLTEGWAYVGCGRDDGKRGGEASGILYKQARFDLNASDTFWLSETPDVVGSESWNTACTRICTWARLTDRVTGHQFIFLNTHLDHKSAVARENGMKLILRRMPELARGLPIILTGDLNATPESSPVLLAREKLRDAADCSATKRTGPSGTFNGFKFNEPPVALPIIDYIFVSEGIEVRTHATLDDSENGLYPSDHFPVAADLVLQ